MLWDHTNATFSTADVGSATLLSGAKASANTSMPSAPYPCSSVFAEAIHPPKVHVITLAGRVA
jgi:hypothetical protein